MKGKKNRGKKEQKGEGKEGGEDASIAIQGRQHAWRVKERFANGTFLFLFVPLSFSRHAFVLLSSPFFYKDDIHAASVCMVHLDRLTTETTNNNKWQQ